LKIFSKRCLGYKLRQILNINSMVRS